MATTRKTKANQTLEKMIEGSVAPKKTVRKRAPKKVEAPKQQKEESIKEAQTAKNTSKAIQQTVINRELKWLYPDGCLDTLSRKAFRQKARNSITGLERKIWKLMNPTEDILEKYPGKKLETQIQKLKREALEKRKQYLADPEADV